MKNYEIVFFEQTDGFQPVADFIRKLDRKMSAKILRFLELLSEVGPELREPYSKPLGDGIFELRTQVGNDTSRVLYFFFIGKKIVLTNGFVKKTQKTPSSEIELAKKRRAAYLEKMEGVR